MWEWTGSCSSPEDTRLVRQERLPAPPILQLNALNSQIPSVQPKVPAASHLNQHPTRRYYVSVVISHLPAIWGNLSPHLSSVRMPGVKIPFWEGQRDQKPAFVLSWLLLLLNSSIQTRHRAGPKGHSQKHLPHISNLLARDQCSVPPGPWEQSSNHTVTSFPCTLMALTVCFWGLASSFWKIKIKFALDRFRVTFPPS